MAVEPQMQRRWEEQLAAYVAASFRVLSLGNTASQVVQFVSKIVTAGILYFGAKLVGAALDELKRGLEDGTWRRHEDRIHATAVILPDHEEDGDGGRAI